MNIQETIERECCDMKDMVPYKGVLKDYDDISPFYFCKHCGELWIMENVLYDPELPDLCLRRLFSGQPPTDIFEFLYARGHGWMRASNDQ